MFGYWTIDCFFYVTFANITLLVVTYLVRTRNSKKKAVHAEGSEV